MEWMEWNGMDGLNGWMGPEPPSYCPIPCGLISPCSVDIGRNFGGVPKFELVSVLRQECDWDLALSCASQWLPPSAVTSLVSTRCELQPDAVLSNEEQAAVEVLAPLLNTLHEE
ncbi:hypothetical protein FHG87_022864 [Trinorchestia longiramus]|nr:hypothetical protein FHG87_022864 [Trinorchestia longiramus]